MSHAADPAAPAPAGQPVPQTQAQAQTQTQAQPRFQGAAAGFGIYIHWPYCRAKCPYCDFNSHVASAGIDEAAHGAAYLAELDHFAALLPTPRRRVETIFFGGGTPSLMPPRLVARLIEGVAARWPLAPDIEITLEANPSSVEAARFADLARAGVGRVSLGLQALDDTALAFLGREHSAREGLEAVALAGRHFDRWSFDLIAARPGQTPRAWQRELDAALDHAGGHLSVYQLTIEPGTAFAPRYRRGEFSLPDPDMAAAIYETTADRLARHGLPAYEISNHAAPGQECRHNLIYWRGGDWLGIGPGAHGRLSLADGTRHATETRPAPAAWLGAVRREGHGLKRMRPLSPRARLEEAAMMGLRLAEGGEIADLEAAAGADLDTALDPARRADLVASGDLIESAARLTLTRQGRLRLNAVLGHLLT